jgi:hypothetical protein
MTILVVGENNWEGIMFSLKDPHLRYFSRPKARRKRDTDKNHIQDDSPHSHRKL